MSASISPIRCNSSSFVVTAHLPPLLFGSAATPIDSEDHNAGILVAFEMSVMRFFASAVPFGELMPKWVCDLPGSWGHRPTQPELKE